MQTTFNDTFLKACKMESVDHIPVWFMRQAGRYQAEYQEIKKKYSILDICKTPEICKQVTLLPVQQFSPDAAILFSDILVPLEPMGISFEYKKGYGPLIHNPVRSPEDVDNLKSIDCQTDLSFTGNTLNMLKDELSIPCLGFVGAPFTLASYMIEGGPSKSYENLKYFMYNHTDAWHKLMDKLANEMATYLLFQIANGASAVQIFDSWVGALTREDYKEMVLPHMNEMVQKVKQGSDVPVIMFGVNTSHLLDLFKSTGVDVVGIDWKTKMDSARSNLLANEVAVQGNLDPTLLLADWNRLEKAVHRILVENAHQPGFVFNLGHGILPSTPTENVRRVIEYVQQYKLD